MNGEVDDFFSEITPHPMRMGWEEKGSPGEHLYALGHSLAAAAIFMSLQTR